MSNIYTPGTWITIPWPTIIAAPTSDPQIMEIDPVYEPKKKNHSDGCSCRKCKTFYPYAEPPENEKEFICWGCRHGY